MLDVAKVIGRSDNGRFDTVFFFDRNVELVLETQKLIPGAIGFSGDFLQTVLADDPEEEQFLASEDALVAPRNDEDTSETRNRQRLLAERRQFILKFPFDVMNFDLETFLFKPKEPIPGRMICALRKVFDWQHRKLCPPHHENPLDGFSLMFTTQIGPPNLTEEYRNMLRTALSDNIRQDQNLGSALRERTGLTDVARLQDSNFELFFKLGMPKVLLQTLMETDWYVDPRGGIKIFQFERPSTSGPYKVLHLVMDVRRHNPPRDRRAPMRQSNEALRGYRDVARQIFVNPEVCISDDTIDSDLLQKSLDRIKARRKKYYPEE